MTKEFILNLPKEINDEGCWLYTKSLYNKGYGRVYFEKTSFLLHRLVLSIWFGLDYDDHSWFACHIVGCLNRNCFIPQHLYVGTALDNNKDTVKNKTHNQIRKTHCPLGHEYDGVVYRKNGKAKRYCKVCARLNGKRCYENKKRTNETIR